MHKHDKLKKKSKLIVRADTRLNTLEEQVQELQGRVTLLEGPGTQNEHGTTRTVNIYLTEDVCRYLGATAENQGDDLVITQVDEGGWVFVERFDTAGEEGSGVWVDAAGNEQHGPTG